MPNKTNYRKRIMKLSTTLTAIALATASALVVAQEEPTNSLTDQSKVVDTQSSHDHESEHN